MKKLVHTRGISIETFDLGDHYILVEGSLIDHRYRPRLNEASEEPELVHHMVISLMVKGPGMVIEQAEATMPHHPRRECPDVLPWIRNLEGLEIAPGYSIKGKSSVAQKDVPTSLASSSPWGNPPSKDTGLPISRKVGKLAFASRP
jgi:hypothetical protein